MVNFNIEYVAVKKDPAKSDPAEGFAAALNWKKEKSKPLKRAYYSGGKKHDASKTVY